MYLLFSVSGKNVKFDLKHLIFLLNILHFKSRISDWTGADEDEKDVNVWEDNWDDDNVEDDFSVQLRYKPTFR